MYVVTPQNELQDLGFSFKKFGKGFKKGFKTTAQIAGAAAPVIGAVGGPEAGAAAKMTSDMAAQWKLQNLSSDEVTLQALQQNELQDLGFSFKKFGKGFKKGFKTTAAIAGAAAPVIGAVGGPEAGAAAKIVSDGAAQWKLVNLESLSPEELQELGFNIKKFGKDFGKGFKTGFKETAKVAGVAAPVLGVVAGPEAGIAAAGVSAAGAAWKLQNLTPEMQVLVLNSQGVPATLENLDFWHDFGKGFQKGFSETAKVAKALSPAAETMAKTFGGKDGKEIADAIHTSTEITGQIGDAVSKFQNLNGEPVYVQNLDFWHDFGKGFQKGFSETAKVAKALSPAAETMAKTFGGKDGKEIADAIHTSTQITGQIGDAVSKFQNLNGEPVYVQNLDFWSDFGKGFQKGFTETAKVAKALSPAAETMAQTFGGKDGKEIAQAIHTSTEITGQIGDAVSKFQNLQGIPVSQAQIVPVMLI